MSRRAPKAFTLVELLVVMAICGVLLALVVPAAMRARETARRGICADHLRQLGLGLANYESAHGVLPPGYVSEWYPIGGNDRGPGWGWGAQLLPMLERSDVHDLINFSIDVDWPESLTARHRRVAAFLCPSDNMPELIEARVEEIIVVGGKTVIWSFPLCQLAGANYVGVFGVSEPGVAGEGVFFRNSAIRGGDIVDGRTQTLAAGERSLNLNYGRGGASWVGSVARALLTSCGSADPDAIGNCHTEDASGFVLGHTGEGNGPGATGGDANQFLSRHGYGAQFVFCDGHVQFLHGDMNYRIYKALSTRAGGEPCDGACY